MVDAEYIKVKQKPIILTRWWLKTKEVKAIVYPNNLIGASYEFYVPLWAWPLELLHRMIFKQTKLN